MHKLNRQQVRTALDELQITQTELAQLFEIDISSVQRWCAEGMTGPTVLLLLALANDLLSIAEVRSLGNFKRRAKSKRPR